MSSFKILSLDGGGIRGVVSLVILERLEAEVPGLLEETALFAGTSTGGIIALGLAHGLSITDLRDLYEKRGERIFSSTFMRKVFNLGKTIGAEYDNRSLAAELTEIFGDTKLGELKKKVLIPSFNLDKLNEETQKRYWAPKFFHNFPGSDSDGEELVRNVALNTTAAPTYFPSSGSFIDGGVVANNPSVAALTQALDGRTTGVSAALENTVLLSIGTGDALDCIERRDADWGLVQWARPILKIMMEGVMGVADFQCGQILGERYFRIQPVFPNDEAIALDGIDKVEDLARLGESLDLADAVEWLRNAWSDDA